jgi:hypothetical protein
VRMPVAILLAELIRRRRNELVERTKQVLADDPTAVHRFTESLSDRDFDLLISEIRRLKAKKEAAEALKVKT